MPSASNSILKAAALWREEGRKNHQTFPSFLFSLEKNLPVAAGIGGGSSDASATLRLLQKHFPLKHHDTAQLKALSLKIGADGPVTINSFPKRMQGIGEILSEIPAFPTLGILLVNPGIKVSTPKIFKNLSLQNLSHSEIPAFPEKGWENADALFSFLKQTRNDLQLPASELVPEITQLLSQLKQLPACQIARMSGSGATCFALFHTKNDADEAERMLRSSPETPKNWWIWSGETYPSKRT